MPKKLTSFRLGAEEMRALEILRERAGMSRAVAVKTGLRLLCKLTELRAALQALLELAKEDKLQ